MTQNLSRTVRTRSLMALTSLLFCVALLAVPPNVRAATYAVDSCQHPDGAVAGRGGWFPESAGAFVYYGDNCAAGGGLDAAFEPTLEHDFGDVARWVFSAPSGTTLERISATESGRAGLDRAFGSPEAFVRSDMEYLTRCAVPYGCAAVENSIDVPLNARGRVEFGVVCGGRAGGRCPAGVTAMSFKRIRVVLRDDGTPTFTAAPTGSLTSPTSTVRRRTVTYSANDVGGGIYWQRLLADGKLVADAPVDTNDGRCVRYPVGNGFSSPVPCRTTASGSLTYDTAGLSDGAHDLELQVFDATSENKVVSSWAVKVDNAPPVVGDVQIGGIAREAELLRCGAAIDGQSAEVSYQWLRSTPDGSDVADIPGSNDQTYRAASGDVGRKLLCRMTVTDGGGSTVRTSSLTIGPFSGGRVVVAGAGGGTSGASAAAITLAPLPVCTRASLRLSGATRQFTRSYTRSGIKLSGRLTASGGGAALGGAPLDVVQTVTRAGTSRRTKVASARTAASGSFRVTLPRGPTRRIQLVDPSCGSLGPGVTERVRGMVHAKTTTRRVRNKQVARFSGRVLGGYVGRGLPLELQVKVGSSWKDVKAVTSDTRGGYRVSYRFLRTFVRYTYRFRIVTRAGSSWPFMPARSGQVSVRVN